MAADDPVQVVRSLYPALAGGDRDALGQLLAPDFVGETTAGLPLGLGGRYDGPEAMRQRFWGVIGRHWDVAAEPDQLERAGPDQVMVTGTYRGAGRSSGIKFEAAFVHLVTVRGEQITGLVQVTDTAAWAAALGGQPDLSRGAVTFAVEGGIAQIRLNRPDSANAIDAETARGIRAAAQRCHQDPSIRVVTLSGAGDRFSAGGDLKLFAETPPERLPALLDSMITDYHEGLALLASLPVPVICAVQGAAAGGALGLLHVADIVLAADDARFAVGYGPLALSSDGGSTWHLPRLVGPKIAALMYLDNKVLTAAEALACGLVSEVVPAAELRRRAGQLTDRLAAGPVRAFGQIRQLLRRSASATLSEQLDAERRSLVDLAGAPDAREGIAAFAGKRPPRFPQT